VAKLRNNHQKAKEVELFFAYMRPNLYLCNLMKYADVILPLPLQGTFTYAIPDNMQVAVGMRVLVPLGRSKTYVGLVDRIHDV
jgi:hypothetical protein